MNNQEKELLKKILAQAENVGISKEAENENFISDEQFVDEINESKKYLAIITDVLISPKTPKVFKKLLKKLWKKIRKAIADWLRDDVACWVDPDC